MRRLQCNGIDTLFLVLEETENNSMARLTLAGEPVVSRSLHGSQAQARGVRTVQRKTVGLRTELLLLSHSVVYLSTLPSKSLITAVLRTTTLRLRFSLYRTMVG